MKRAFLLIFLLGIFYQVSEAQLWKLKRLELSGGLGVTSFYGDVGGYSHGLNWGGIKDITFLQTRYDASFSVKYRVTRDVNIRVSLSSGLFRATDQRGSNEGRRFESRTTFMEPALMGEYYFIRNGAENSYLFNKGKSHSHMNVFKRLDFCFFTGVGGLFYTINANERLAAHGLDPNGTALVIPIGLGGDFAAFPSFNLGAEFGFRYSFSDNLDGYTSQYSSSNDVYYFFNLTATYRLKIKKKIFPSFR
jgi:hypothetical protein